MERVSGTAGQKAMAFQQLGKNSLQNLCTSICAMITQLVSLITNNSRLFIMKSRVLFLWFGKLSEIIFFKAEFFFLEGWQNQER